MSATTVNRKLAAIVFVDIVDFSRRMSEDERAGLDLRRDVEHMVKGSTLSHSGRMVKNTGDGAMLEFASAVAGVSCALEIREQIRQYNVSHESTNPMQVRIGIHVGDVAEEDDDLYGNAVNIAQRVMTMASPDGICITREVYAQIRPILKVVCERVDTRPEKRMHEDVEVLRVLQLGAEYHPRIALKPSHYRRAKWLAAGLLVAGMIAGGFYVYGVSSRVRAIRQSQAQPAAANPQREAEERRRYEAAKVRFARELDLLLLGNLADDLSARWTHGSLYFDEPVFRAIHRLLAALSESDQSSLLDKRYLLWRFQNLPAKWQDRWKDFWRRALKAEDAGRFIQPTGVIAEDNNPLGPKGSGMTPAGWGQQPKFGSHAYRSPNALQVARLGFVILRAPNNQVEELWIWVLFPTEKRCWQIIDSRERESGWIFEGSSYFRQWAELERQPDSALPE